jgi:hypothetical protein
MAMTTPTLRLPGQEARDLLAACKLTGRSCGAVVCGSLRARHFSSRVNAVQALAVPRAARIELLAPHPRGA